MFYFSGSVLADTLFWIDFAGCKRSRFELRGCQFLRGRHGDFSDGQYHQFSRRIVG